MQTVRISDCGDMLRIVVYTRATRWDSEAARKQKREWRQAAWRRMNFRTCREKLEERIACNFSPDDWHIVFTLAPEYETQNYKVLRNYWRKALKTLRRIRKMRGAPAPVYIYVVEGLHGDKRLHIHALLQAVPDDIEDYHSCWPYGEVFLTRISDFEHRDHMGQYLTKEPAKFGRDRNDRNLFVASHNCLKPSVTCYGIPDGEMVSVPDGYRVEHQEAIQSQYGSYHYIVCRRTSPIHS